MTFYKNRVEAALWAVVAALTIAAIRKRQREALVASGTVRRAMPSATPTSATRPTTPPPASAAPPPAPPETPDTSVGNRSTPGVHAPVHPRAASSVNVSKINFGEGSRTKARNRKMRARLGAVAAIAALLGVPGATFGADMLGSGVGSPKTGLTRADFAGTTTTESAAGLMKLRSNLFQSRPTPPPTPTVVPTPEPEPVVEAEPEVAAPAPVAPAGSITEILYAAAAEFGLDGAYLVSVASCESGLNPNAVNPAGYHGLFQFSESTWASYGYGSIYDPTAQARTAARMLAAGMASQWPNCA